VSLARVENYSNDDAAALGVVQRVEDCAIHKGVGREIDRTLSANNERSVDRVESLFGRIVDLLGQSGRNGAERRKDVKTRADDAPCPHGHPSDPRPSAVPSPIDARFMTTSSAR